MRPTSHRGAWALSLLLGAACLPLASPVALADTVGDAAAVIEHDFVGARKCKSCHGKELMGDQNATWSKGPHYQAFETLKNAESLALGQARGLEVPPSEAPECLACHVTAFGVPAERIWKPLQHAEGVQCESCHGPGRDYRKKKVMDDLDRARAKGLWNPDGEHGICLRCHNEASPTFDPQRYTLEDGSTSGFDYPQAAERISHPIPADVKGRYLELRKKQKEEEERSR